MATPADVSKGQRGVFFLLEGLDRSGKSTHAKHLVKVLQEEHNIPAQYYQFPNRNTKTGQKINEYLTNKTDLDDKAIHQLFTDNRIEVQDELKKALDSGISIVADRYAYSGAAFSSAKEVADMDLYSCFAGEIGLLAPDVVLYMNVSPDVAKKRGGYGQERYEVEAFQTKVRGQFDKIISLSPTWDEMEQNLVDQVKTFQNGQSQEEQSESSESNSQKVHKVDTFSYISPWYKISSDDEFEEVAPRVQYIATKVFEIQKHQPLHRLSQFPQTYNSSNMKNDFPTF